MLSFFLSPRRRGASKTKFLHILSSPRKRESSTNEILFLSSSSRHSSTSLRWHRLRLESSPIRKNLFSVRLDPSLRWDDEWREFIYWVPASAGMTEGVGFHLSQR
jgi:hypothetical protein